MSQLLKRAFVKQPQFHSRFGGLWIDRKDADQLLESKRAHGKISASEYEQLRSFMEQGFIVLPNAVPRKTIDQLNHDIDSIWAAMDGRFKVQTAYGAYKKLNEVERNRVLAKLLDVYVYSSAARQVVFTEPVLAFMKLIFEDDVLAFQSLSFEVGSTQAVHQDGAYVVVNAPLKFAACWVAREDIKAGSGELVYYPKSHRFPDFCFGNNRKHWDPHQDGKEAHDRFLTHLHDRARERGLSLTPFCPRRGDALIWHADLAHGGGPIADNTLTRQSFVTHYCPLSVDPHYFGFAPEQAKRARTTEGGWISSWFYDIDAVNFES